MKRDRNHLGLDSDERNGLWDGERGHMWMELVGKVTERDVGGQV